MSRDARLAIAQRVRQLSGDVLFVQQTTLYLTLHKLETHGLITAEWDTSDTNRRAKYYAVTRPSRQRPAQERADWERLSTAVTLVARGSHI